MSDQLEQDHSDIRAIFKKHIEAAWDEIEASKGLSSLDFDSRTVPSFGQNATLREETIDERYSGIYPKFEVGQKVKCSARPIQPVGVDRVIDWDNETFPIESRLIIGDSWSYTLEIEKDLALYTVEESDLSAEEAA